MVSNNDITKQNINVAAIPNWIKEFNKLPDDVPDYILGLSKNKNISTIKFFHEYIEIYQTHKLVKNFGERFAYFVALSILSNRYTPKEKFVDDLKTTYNIEELKVIAKRKFSNKNLMHMIKRELDKDHAEDMKGKLVTFLVACSSHQIPKYRVSIALRGDTSVGKSNLIRCILMYLPKHWFALGTRFTRATLEDDIEQFNLIVFSERKNEHDKLTQTIKSLTEDGIQIWKHDKETNKLRDPKFVPRKSSIYSSTERETDEELATRYIVYHIQKSSAKIGKVLQQIQHNYSSVDAQLEAEKRKSEPNWLSVGLGELKDFDEIRIPFSEYILFNNEYSRCPRDTKRFLNLVAVCAWINQYQREQEISKDNRVLIASVDDFFWVAFLTEKIFFDSISNIDGDLKKTIDTYYEMIKDIDKTHVFNDETLSEKLLYVRMNDLLQELNINFRTLKKQFYVLKQKGMLEIRRMNGRGKEIWIAITPDKKNANYYLLQHNFEKLYYVLMKMDKKNKNKNNHKYFLKDKFENIKVLFQNNKLSIFPKDDEFYDIQLYINDIIKNKENPKIVDDFSIDVLDDEPPSYLIDT